MIATGAGSWSDPAEPQASAATAPTALRIALGAQLRQLREARGISREEAGDAIRGSDAKISRMELGRVGLKERDVRDLLALYGITDPEERDQFIALAKRANTQGWWHEFGDVMPRWFEMFVGLEQAASVIRTYEAQFVPGLLQSPDYARAVIGLGPWDAQEVERRRTLRLQRQQLLSRPAAPKLWAVIEETALHRPTASAEVMRAQLEHLVAMAERPNITLQLVPQHFGGHPVTGVAFTMLRFAEPDLPDITYIEQLTGALYLDKRRDVDHYAAALDSLCAQILTPAETIANIRRLIDEDRGAR
jgi:transcriptional regulator with XRE-family HTH domain